MAVTPRRISNAFSAKKHVKDLQAQVATLQTLTSAMSSGELGVLDSVTPGTAAASKAVVLDANKDVAGVNVAGVARLDLDSGTGTFSSNAVTITKWTAVLTTESLTTAHTEAATLVITKTGVAAGDIPFISLMGGTNTGGVPLFKAVCTTNTVTITLQNAAIATNAFNGTFIFAIHIAKA